MPQAQTLHGATYGYLDGASIYFFIYVELEYYTVHKLPVHRFTLYGIPLIDFGD